MKYPMSTCSKFFTIQYLALSFFIFCSYNIICIWPWPSNDPQTKFTCKMSNLGGTLPNDVCVLRDFLKKVKAATKQHIEIKSEDKIGTAWLFHGHPGVGKTTGAHLITEEANIEIDFHDSREISKRISETHNPAGVITDIFESAKQKATHRPIILVIDEIDGLAKNHQQSMDIIYSSMRTLIDEYKKNSNLLIIFTSNQTYHLDEGFKGRCAQVEWLKPNSKNREQILFFYANRFSVILTQKFVTDMIAETNNFSGREFYQAFVNARKIALYENKELDETCINQGITVEKKKLNERKWEHKKEGIKWYVAKAEAPLAAIATVGGIILFYLKKGSKKTSSTEKA